MRIKTYRSLGMNVPLQVPSTVEENDQLANAGESKRINPTLEDAVDNVVYRSSLADFRSLFCEAVEVHTGIKRHTKPVLDKKTNEPKKNEDGSEKFVYTESEAEYFDRVLAATSRSIESFEDLKNSVVAKVKYDPTASERGEAGPKTPPKSVYEQVDALINSGQATGVAASLTAILGRQVDADRESLARGIHEDQLNELRKVKNKWTVPATS